MLKFNIFHNSSYRNFFFNFRERIKRFNPTMICQNIGLSVGNSSRIDKLNFKFLLTVNMYLNMSMIAYRLISIEKRENIHFQIDLLSKCFVYSGIRFFPFLSIPLYSLNKIKGNFIWPVSLQFFKHVTQTA